jgi:hypothetical protein
MADYPRFFSKNYVAPRIVDFQNDLSNIIDSSNDANKKFLFDRNKNTQWSGTGGVVNQIDSCDDDPVAWVSADPEVTVSRDTSVKHEGTASVRFQFSSSWAGGLAAYHNLALGDLSEFEKLKIWFYPNLSGLQNFGFVLSQSLNCATQDRVEYIGQTLTPSTWNEIIWDVSWGVLTDVKSIGIRDISTPLANLDLRMDDVRITKEYEEIEVEFYEGSVALDRTINTLLLQNINLKKFKLQYEDSGGDWADVPGTVFTDNSNTRVMVEFSDITTGRMRLRMDETIIADQPKKVGEFWLLNNLYDLTDAMDIYRPTRIQDWGSNRLANFGDSLWWLNEKYKAVVGFRRITVSELEELKTIYDLHEEVVWLPEPESRPDEIYLVNFKSPWSEPYSSLYKGLGFNVDFTLEEV